MFVPVLMLGNANGQVERLALEQGANTWVKRSPLKDAPRSPMLGYEGSFGYGPKAKLLIRWAGHNQGGGGEQNAETWTFDPATARWTLKEPNTSPPGACCNAQNVFDHVLAYDERDGVASVRVPGKVEADENWHYETWTYDHAKNTWKKMNPSVEPPGGGQRRRIMAAIPDQNVIVMESYVNPGTAGAHEKGPDTS
jgi:hypothetical protein